MSLISDLQDYATRQATAFGIPPSLFLWQLGQESSWNPNATSDAGVHLGIGQFDLPTAAQFGLTDRTNPYASIDAAAQYDAQLYAQTGSYQKMLAGYGTAFTPSSPQSVNDAATAAINNSAATNYFSRLWDGILNSFGFGPGVPTLHADGTVTPASPNNNQRGNILDVGSAVSLQGWLTRGTAIFVGLILIAGGVYLFGAGRAPLIIKEALK